MDPRPSIARHVFNAYWTYELPFGKGQRFLNKSGLLDRIVGGWTIGGRETIGSGNPFLLNGGRNTVNNLTQSGVVFTGGYTAEQLQSALSTVAGGFSSTALMSNVGTPQTEHRHPRIRRATLRPPLRASSPGSYICATTPLYLLT